MSPSSHLLRCILTVSLLSLLVGCYPVLPGLLGNKTIDETRHAAWWGDAHRNEVLQLKEDALLNSDELTLNAYKITDGYDSGTIFGKNITVEMFKANPNGYWPELHLLRKGTRLRCLRLERFYSVASQLTIVWAEILDGDFRGKLVGVGLGYGSPDRKGSFRLDTRLVEPVQ